MRGLRGRLCQRERDDHQPEHEGKPEVDMVKWGVPRLWEHEVFLFDRCDHLIAVINSVFLSAAQQRDMSYSNNGGAISCITIAPTVDLHNSILTAP